MTKVCRGTYSCGRTMPETLFHINRGKITNICLECQKVQASMYRMRNRPERIDYVQVARDFCNKLIKENKC